MAPPSTISQALNNFLDKHKGTVLYVCGNVPVILSGIATHKTQLKVKQAKNADAVLSILEETNELFILFEHDRSLYDDDADLIRQIGRVCRRKVAERGTVTMVATRPDGWLNKFEPFAHRMTYLEESVHSIPGTSKHRTSPQQKTLNGVI